MGAAYPGGSYIWNQTPSSWNNEYEVRTTITLNGNGGTYQEYLLAQPNEVDMRWQEPVDTTGVGIVQYYVLRSPNNAYNWANVSAFFTEAGAFSDEAVSSSATYQYAICQVSFHGVAGGCPVFSVTIPDAGNVDPRRYGVRPTGSYWGDKGEKIDTLSGNLNYTLPLFKAMSRGGGGVTFSLSYNAQMWRQDWAGTWLLGEDVGYGLGWKLMAGSLTPYWEGLWGSVDHYLFTDSTGAEYHLTGGASSGLWTSQESIYVTYDSNANILHFNDGSYWIMGCTSGGLEADLGTMYPTQIEDSNGNYILVTYQDGAGTSWPNSSARISTVKDVRYISGIGAPATYTFTYDLNSGELSTIVGSFNGTTQTYSFSTVNRGIASPTSSLAYWGTANMLASVTAEGQNATQFTYDTGAELTQVTFPTGGHLRYSYLTWNYAGAVTGQIREIREVNDRYLSMNSDGSNELTYPIGRAGDANDGTLGVHEWCTLADPSGVGYKVWYFNASSSTPVPELGLISSFQEVVSDANGYAPRDTFYHWSQDSAGDQYIGEKITVWDQNNSMATIEQQTLDTNGNVLTRNVYDYGSYSTPIRKYTYTYLSGSQYSTRYINNRLASVVVTDGNGNNAATLVSNQYDTAPGACTVNATEPTYNSPPMHDDANYPATFTTRGNLTLSTTPSGATCTLVDYLGNTYFTQGPHSPGIAVASGTSAYSALPTEITANGDGDSTVNLSYSAMFEPLGFSGPNGATSTASYDAWGRVTQSQSVDGAVTVYTYSAAGVLPVTQLAVTSPLAGNPNVQMTTQYRWKLTTLDGLGRAIKVQSGTGQTAGTAVSETDTVYGPCACSPMGKMTQVSQPYAPGNTVYWTTYAYDAIGRTVSVTAADGSTTAYSYSGNTTTVTDAAGKWKTTTVDVQGNTTQVYEPDPSGATSGLYTYYTYDVMEHLTQVSMPRGSVTQTRTFNYSSSTHLLTSETHPETGTTQYSYSPDSFTFDKLASKTDAKGQVTVYSYDAYYRVTEIQRYPYGLSGGEDVCQRVTYTYDSYDNETSGFYGSGQWGHVAAVATGNPTGCTVPGYPVAQQFTQMFSYNATGRVTTKRLELDQPGTNPEYWDVNYTYNQLGQMVTTTYPGATTNSAGITYTTGYDSVDRPTTLKDSRGITVVQGVTYNAANQPLQTTFQYPSGGTFTETRTYNQLNELTAINNFGGTVSLAYNFTGGQNNGQIASSVDAGTTISYSYDLLKRLTSATSGAWSQTYGYDGFGNLTAKNGSGATFTNTVDQTTNRLTGGNYCYDADGNMISDQNGGGCGSPNYAYDVANRLVSAKVSGGTEYYWYGADNKRIAKFGTGGETIYVYGAFGEKLSVANTESVIGNNLYFAGRLIKQNTDAVLASADNNFVAVDRMGSVVYAAATSAGAPTVNTSYLPYGEELSATTNDVIKFATYTRDANTGLDYADQRYYTSQFGRFMSADRFRQAAKANDSGSWNKYSLGRGDPINRVDHHGTEDFCDDDPDSCDPPCEGDAFADSCGDPGGGGPGSIQAPSQPNCEDGYTSAQLSFVQSNYASAVSEAGSIQSLVDSAGVSINQTNVADAFLDWSAYESGWGQSGVATANHNYFGASAGSWGGTASSNCAKSQFACWSVSTSWGAELADILNFAPHAKGNPNPGNAPYSAFLALALINNPNASPAVIIQSIASAGFNSANKAYGQTIAGPTGVNVQPIVDCLRQNGALK